MIDTCPICRQPVLFPEDELTARARLKRAGLQAPLAAIKRPDANGAGAGAGPEEISLPEGGACARCLGDLLRIERAAVRGTRARSRLRR